VRIRYSPMRRAERAALQILLSVSFRLLCDGRALDYSTDIKMTPEEVEAQIRSFY